MRIRMTKRPEGGAVLHCTRDDGSVTWQKPPEKQALFFALHDLTHFAVETELGYRHGFYGLIAGGWDVDDTTGKGRRGPLPAEAIEVEHVAGLFDTERGAGVMWTVEEFNGGLPETVARRFSAEELARVRQRRGQLFHQWTELAPGQALELEFPGTGASARA